MTPPVSEVRQDDTHRLIPSRYADESVLTRLGSDNELQAIFDLDAATNDRLLGEANLLPGITVHELLFGVAYAQIVNAAFCHAQPNGSRFNGPDRGAWYAAFDLKTSQMEVAYHKQQELIEIDWTEPETFAYVDYLADFRGAFHDLRSDAKHADCLDPNSYTTSRALARELLAASSAGIVYPSVRHRGGTCLVCFRPALVGNVRKGGTTSIAFRHARSRPTIR